MNRCGFRKLMHRYCDGELSGHDLARCEKHLEHCENCRTLLQELLSLRTLFVMKPPVNPVPGFHERIHTRIQNLRQDPVEPARHYSMGALSRKFAPMAAGFLFLTGGMAAFLSFAPRDSLDTTGLQYYAVSATETNATASLKDISSFVLTEQERTLMKAEGTNAVDAFYAMIEDTML